MLLQPKPVTCPFPYSEPLQYHCQAKLQVLLVEGWRQKTYERKSVYVSTEMTAVLRQIEVRGVDGELKKIAESKLTIKPNFAYTLSEVRDDIQRVFDAGYFQQILPAAEDTRDGIKLTLQVQPSECTSAEASTKPYSSLCHMLQLWGSEPIMTSQAISCYYCHAGHCQSRHQGGHGDWRERAAPARD